MMRRNDERGSAVVELALLLPVYVVLLLGVVLLGEATLLKQEMSQAGTLYSLEPGSQTREELVASHFSMFEGAVTSFDDAENSSDVYSGGDIEDALDRIGTGEFFNSYIVTPLGLQAVTTGGERTWQGQYIDQHGLMNGHTPDLVSSLLNGWISRNSTQIEYNYKPYFLDSLFGDLAQSLRERGDAAAAVPVEKLIAEGITLAQSNVTSGRGGRTRHIAGEGQYHRAIEGELLTTIDPTHVPLPNYPGFSADAVPFWDAK